MNETNWDEAALHSEIEFSKARGGISTDHGTFIHIHNEKVPYAGDYNRPVGVRLSDFSSFEKVVEQVEKIHGEKGLDKPNRYDIHPPALREADWQDRLTEKGYRIGTTLFFCSASDTKPLPDGISLHTPSEDEYMAWYSEQQKSKDYFDEEQFNLTRPSQLSFIKVFKPYWLLENDLMKGWVYCAHLGAYSRLFEVEIEEASQGKGLGIVLMNAIRHEAAKNGAEYVLSATHEGLRRFYERVGFKLCAKASVIRPTSL